MFFLYVYTNESALPVAIDTQLRNQILNLPDGLERQDMIRSVLEGGLFGAGVLFHEDIDWNIVEHIEMETEGLPDEDDPATVRVYTRPMQS